MTQSGSASDAVVNATLRTSSQSGIAATISVTSATPSGSADASSSVGVMSGEDGSNVTRKVENQLVVLPCNSWNEFQGANRGKHWGSEKMRAEYYKQKTIKDDKCLGPIDSRFYLDHFGSIAADVATFEGPSICRPTKGELVQFRAFRISNL